MIYLLLARIVNWAVFELHNCTQRSHPADIKQGKYISATAAVLEGTLAFLQNDNKLIMKTNILKLLLCYFLVIDKIF